MNTHAFAVYGTGTRTIIINCNVLSKGGDTVALWDYKDGMYYHSNCRFKGAVDFVCPRGWCYIKNSQFYQLKQTASVWHAGGYDINQKLVIENSSFDGVKNFQLGRHHYEAQFYFIDCRFSDNLSDKPIYRVTYSDSTLNRPSNWGERYYFYNCIKEGEVFNWLKNSLTKNEADKVSVKWTFDGKWDPESAEGPKVLKYELNGNKLLLFFNELITVINVPVLKSDSERSFFYHSGAGSNTIRFLADSVCTEEDLAGLKIMNNGKLFGTTASVKEREVVLNL
jgi:pectinesterase